MEGLTEGRIVHFVLPDGVRNAGEHRAALIVKIWPTMKESGTVNMLVFLDGGNDTKSGLEAPLGSVQWQTSVRYSEGKEGRTWHWPEKA